MLKKKDDRRFRRFNLDKIADEKCQESCVIFSWQSMLCVSNFSESFALRRRYCRCCLFEVNSIKISNEFHCVFQLRETSSRVILSVIVKSFNEIFDISSKIITFDQYFFYFIWSYFIIHKYVFHWNKWWW